MVCAFGGVGSGKFLAHGRRELRCVVGALEVGAAGGGGAFGGDGEDDCADERGENDGGPDGRGGAATDGAGDGQDYEGGEEVDEEAGEDEGDVDHGFLLVAFRLADLRLARPGGGSSGASSAKMEEMFGRTNRPSTAAREARIQTRTLPAVGCADLLCIGWFRRRESRLGLSATHHHCSGSRRSPSDHSIHHPVEDRT